MKIVTQLLFLLSSKEKKQASILFIMILIMALMDMLGVATILPFVTVLTNPQLIVTNSVLNYMYEFSKLFGVDNNQQFIFALGVLVFMALIFSLTFKAITSYVQIRFVQMREYSLGKRMIEGYLNQPYVWFLDRHSADLGKAILSEVQQFINNCLGPFLELVAKSIVASTIIILLIIVDPKLAFLVGILITGFYILIFFTLRKYIKKKGEIRLKNNQLRFVAVSEAFGSVKELKVRGFEKTYIKLFANSAKSYALSMASIGTISQLPRFILEVIAFGGILLIILYNMSNTGNFNSTLPILSLYIFAGYRLMPAMQIIYASFTQLTFIKPSLEKLYEDFKNFEEINKNEVDEIISFNEKIDLTNISFTYPNSLNPTLKNLNITIPVKSIVGFIGTTGSGKTTTVDIILGLLDAQKGLLKVDGKVISKDNLKSWQKLIGYVPQNIYLTDDTLASNIALGVEPKDINLQIVEKVSKMASLHNFVTKELPDKYQTRVGERGARLSGGQRQRIGIARALYNDPKILIFDEATSSLDNDTEKKVMENISNLKKKTTIILIAHRLNTIKNCDIVYKFKEGQIEQKGSFEEVVSTKI